MTQKEWVLRIRESAKSDKRHTLPLPLEIQRTCKVHLIFFLKWDANYMYIFVHYGLTCEYETKRMKDRARERET